MRIKITFGLFFPFLCVLTPSVQAVEITPVWVEYTSAPVVSKGATPDAAPVFPSVQAPNANETPPQSSPVVASPTDTSEAVTPAEVQMTSTPLEKPATTTPASLEADNATIQVPNSVPSSTAPTVSAVITPRLFVFDYFKGVGEDKTHFLERYDYRKGFSGDTRSDIFADVDLNLAINNGERDLFVLERKGFGQYNHHGMASFSDDEISLTGAYTSYRSATSGIDYLLSPNQVAGGTSSSGPYQTFNDDANRFDYHVDRTTYGASLKVKPVLLGNMAALTVEYQGYTREGNKFAPFYLDNPSSCPGSGPCITNDADKWRGINVGIDERMNKVAFNIDASPQKLFNINYTISLEKFSSGTPDLSLLDDILAPQGVANTITPGSRRALAPLFYIPDTSLVSQNIRLSKTFSERFLLSLGYAHSTLEDDSTHPRFTTLFGGPPPGLPDSWEGKISTDSAFLTANWNTGSSVNLEGFVKYYNRDNASSFPVENVISPTSPGQLVAPRINDIKSFDYGLAGIWRPGVMSSTMTLGWHRLDRQRDLTFGVAAAEHILPGQTLYREDTLSDEVYLKLIARPARGWNVRLSPSYIWADKTGLVSEPEEATQIKTQVSYTAPAGWLVSGYHDYKHKKNSNNTFTDGAGTPVYAQSIDSTLNSAGVTMNLMPRDSVNTYVNLSWVQDDLSSFLFRTNTERWNPGVAFTLVDKPNYLINSYSLGIGADWQTSDHLKLNGSYSYSRSRGNVASGTVLNELTATTGSVDSRIDGNMHSLAIGADYTIKPNATLRTNYFYDYYDDNAFSLLTGGVQMLSVGLQIKM